MSETNPETNVTPIPVAPKQRRFTNPFKKNDTVPTDANETPAKKAKVPSSVWLAGVALLVTGVVVAAVKSADQEEDVVEEETSTDNTETA